MLLSKTDRLRCDVTSWKINGKSVDCEYLSKYLSKYLYKIEARKIAYRNTLQLKRYIYIHRVLYNVYVFFTRCIILYLLFFTFTLLFIPYDIDTR